MIEKLVEDWLDSAGERSYQACFVQMLGAQGYKVLHSTRHCALEFGKDVLAIAPDGVPCAYQLKGNPGGRLGLSGFRSEIQQQLVQLMSQPIVFPGVSADRPHRSYLVSNGYFDEEVQRAVDDLNRGPYMSKVALISRGELLGWARSLGVSLWPSELRQVRDVLEVFLHDSCDLLPMEKIGAILGSVLHIGLADEPLKAAELGRAIPSAALLTGIITSHFSNSRNHFAIATAWTLFAVSAVSAAVRSGVGRSEALLQSISLAESALQDALAELWEEARVSRHLVESTPMADIELLAWRRPLLHGLFSVLWFFPPRTADDHERRSQIAEWLVNPPAPELWGEAMIPTLLASYFARSRIDPSARPDSDLMRVMRSVIDANQPGSKQPLPDPYYPFEDIARPLFDVRSKGDPHEEENFAGSSYMAEPLLHLVARSRWKLPCTSAWPNFTRLCHKRLEPATQWQFGLLRTREGTEVNRQYPHEYKWSQLLADADESDASLVPVLLSERPHLMLMWTIVAPHRLTSSVARHLHSRLPWR